jgi:hypothetical protein
MDRGGSYACWQNEVFIALAEDGLSAAYDVIARLYKDEPGFPSSCHSIAHSVGLASYQFYRQEGDALFTPKAAACANGFYHGFMEGYFGATGDAKNAGELCEHIGKKIGDGAPDARLQCYHGIGHGSIETMLATTGSFTSIDDMTNDAIRICEEASSGVDERYRCVSGIYNGFANFYMSGQYNLDVKTTDPLLYCSRQKKEYKESCYGNMNSLALWVSGDYFEKAASYMLTIPDSEHKARAIYYLAALEAVPYAGGQSYDHLVEKCRILPTTYRDSCLTGLAHGFLEHGEPEQEYVRAIAFCGNHSLTAREKDTCYSSMLSSLPGWYPQDTVTIICSSLSPELQHYCAQ